MLSPNVLTGRGDPRDRLHCCKTGSEMHWNHPAIFHTSLTPSSLSTHDGKQIAVLVTPIA
jgi:hypothetical protein